MIHMDYMMYCSVNGFLQMSDLKNELDKEWPSLEEEENEKIWKKEWERHGICSEPLLTQHAFFEIGEGNVDEWLFVMQRYFHLERCMG